MLYLVKAHNAAGLVQWAGHFIGDNANDAIASAQAMARRDAPAAVAAGLQPLDFALVYWRATKSKASLANAMNLAR